jgi:hypothetical protein
LISVATPERLAQVRLAALLERLDGGLQHGCVKVEPHLRHLPALLFAEHLARAANLQIVHGEVETGAELLHHLNRIEPLSRLRADRVLFRRQQIGVRLVMRASDPSAQLVQLRKAESSARSMTMVLAVGTSMPVSMIVVQSSTLNRCW